MNTLHGVVQVTLTCSVLGDFVKLLRGTVVSFISQQCVPLTIVY